jgi:hypothetical protein
MAAVSSADGTAAVTTLLEGVTMDEVFSKEDRYLDLHGAEGGELPPLACATLDRR